jgi:hypothetical protein
LDKVEKAGDDGNDLIRGNVPQDQHFRELIQKVEGHRNEEPKLHRFVFAGRYAGLAERF